MSDSVLRTLELFESIQIYLEIPQGIALGVEPPNGEENFAKLVVQRPGAWDKAIGLFVQKDGKIKFAPFSQEFAVGEGTIAINDGTAVTNLDWVWIPWGSTIRILSEPPYSLFEIYVNTTHHFEGV